MRLAAIAVCYLLLSVTVSAECVTVVGIQSLESSPKVTVVVLRDGKPVAGATVDVYKFMALKDPEFSVSTRNDGTATLPRLAPGTDYDVVAVDGEDMNKRAELYLKVSKHVKRSTTPLPMNMVWAGPGPQRLKLESSPRVRVVALWDGKPVAGATVDVYKFMALKDPEFSVSTRNDGTATLPRLAPGIDYDVVVVDGEDMNKRAELYLKVSKHVKRSTTPLPMNMVRVALGPQRPMAVPDERVSASFKVKEFTGVVRDPTGAAIPDAIIYVWMKGTSWDLPLEEIRSDSTGRFFAHLQDGIYIAFFSAPGFHGETVVFEISEEAAPGEVDTNLELAGC
jgi:hypothetical protein